MSGAEFIAVLSIGASALQVIESCTKVVNFVRQFHNNAAFQDLALQLPLLSQAVESLNTPAYRQRLDITTEKALVRVLEGCRRQLNALDDLIQSMTHAETASKLKRTWHGIRSYGKDTKIREIVGVLAEYKATITLHLSAWQARQAEGLERSAGATRSFFEVPAQQVSHFVNRPKILHRIGEAIKESRTNPAVLVLTGVGGQGKTQLALEYCRQAAGDCRTIFWIDASSEVSAVRSFEKIVAKLCDVGQEFADSQAKIAFVKETLRTWPEPWLLVFDNYDLPQAFTNLKNFFPASHGKVKNCILVTSRTACSERLGAHVKVGGLEEDEALELLTSRSPAVERSHEEMQEGRNIVKQLGYLALAIDQAAAYISIRQLPLTLFAEHYEKRKEFILKHTPDSLWEYQTRTEEDRNGSGENLSVLTTWELSFLQIQGNDQEREELGNFLTQSAFLNPTGISENLFNNFSQACAIALEERPSWMVLFLCGEVWDSLRFQDALIGLMNLSLIQTVSINSDEVHFSLHPLIKDWLQLRKSIKIRQEMSFIAISMTASLIRDADSENLRLSDRQELLGHVESCIANTRQYLTTPETKTAYGGIKEGFQTLLASFYSLQDRHVEAEKLFVEALEYQKRELGNFHVETMCTMNELGALYLKINQVEKAELMLIECLWAKKQTLGPDHPRTLNTVNNIGNLYSLQVQLEKAAEMYQRALEGYTKLHGPQHKSVAEAWNNLGEISMKQGRFSVAHRQFTTAIETIRASGGGDTAFTLYVKSNLALIYKFEGFFDRARDLYSEVIEGRCTMQGPGHSLTLQSMCEMGDVFLAEGRGLEAEEWYVKGKASSERRRKARRELLREGERKRPPKPRTYSCTRTGVPMSNQGVDEDAIMPDPPRALERSHAQLIPVHGYAHFVQTASASFYMGSPSYGHPLEDSIRGPPGEGRYPQLVPVHRYGFFAPQIAPASASIYRAPLPSPWPYAHPLEDPIRGPPGEGRYSQLVPGHRNGFSVHQSFSASTYRDPLPIRPISRDVERARGLEMEPECEGISRGGRCMHNTNHCRTRFQARDTRPGTTWQ